MTKTLVLGSTGGTGKYVVHHLLHQSQQVHAIARSKQKLLSLLDEIEPESSSLYEKQLTITEASFLDLTDDEIQTLTKDVDAVVSCLGHNLTFGGLFGKPRKLVTDATRRIFTALEESTSSNEKKKVKFILMGTEGVSNPAGGDDARTKSERCILFLLRYLLPPHSDNESAAALVYTAPRSHIRWTVIRPTDLIDGPTTKYELFPKPQGSLFGGEDVATRANVAKCMVDMILTESLWEEWKFGMPYVQDGK